MEPGYKDGLFGHVGTPKYWQLMKCADDLARLIAEPQTGAEP